MNIFFVCVIISPPATRHTFTLLQSKSSSQPQNWLTLVNDKHARATIAISRYNFMLNVFFNSSITLEFAVLFSFLDCLLSLRCVNNVRHCQLSQCKSHKQICVCIRTAQAVKVNGNSHSITFFVQSILVFVEIGSKLNAFYLSKHDHRCYRNWCGSELEI